MPRPNRGYQLGFYQPKGYKARQWVIFWYDRGTKREHATGLVDSRAAKDAEAARAEFVQARERPSGPLPAERLSIAQALDYYAAEHGPQTADPARIGYAVDALLPFFGALPVSAVKGETCRAYQRSRVKTVREGKKRREVPVAPATVRRELGTLKAAFSHCYREGYLTTLPGVWLPPKTRGRDRWLTRTEAARLLRAARAEPLAKPHLPIFILLGLYTGQRAEAILSLQWAPNVAGGHVDLSRGVIDFNPQGRARTKKARSIIPIPAKLRPILEGLRRRTGRHLIEVDGKPVTYIRRSFRTACRNAKVTGVVRHTLRHTCCTWLAQAGVDIWKAAGWVEMSEETFRSKYAHHHPDYLADVKNAVGRKSPSQNPLLRRNAKVIDREQTG